MSICSSGVSQLKPGYPQRLVVDQNYIQALLPAALSWLYPYLPWMHGLEIGDTTAFCVSDPPTWTVPTPDQIFTFITNGPINDALLVDKFIRDITKAYIWYQICQCASVSTPAPPTAPSAPANLPVVNPPQVAAPPILAACFHQVSGPAAFGVTGNTQAYVSDPWPAAATSVTMITNSSAAGASHPVETMTVNFIGAKSPAITPVIATQVFTIASGAIRTDRFDVPQGTKALQVVSTGAAGATSTDLLTLTLDVYCSGGVVGGPQPAPCPPDPAVRQLLKQIYDLLTIVQRQAAPFGYVYGANHTALSDNGTIAVSDLIGCSVDITTLPDNYGRNSGAPDELFGLGWVAMSTVDGITQRRRLDADGILFLPGLGGVFTNINYSLSGGVVVSIRELIREP